jgi:NADH-quinone oxidoreductase subunit H
MLFMSTIIVIFFFGGWLAPASILSIISPIFIFAIKITLFCFLFVLVRASYPRYRYDQLMDLGWKIFLPLSLAYLVLLAAILTGFGSLPQILEINVFPYTENILFDYFTMINGTQNIN